MNDFLRSSALPSRPARQEAKHSIIRVKKGGSVKTDGVLYFTESGLTAAKGAVAPIKQNSMWAQRPRHQNHEGDTPPTVSMFAPPFTTRESFGERVMKRPTYLKVGDELHWPSFMSSEGGTELILGVDGSLLIKKQAIAADAAAVNTESDPVVEPLVTLIAADMRKSNRALEKRLLTGRKAVDADLPGRTGGFRVPGSADIDAGGRTILTVTNVGDVVRRRGSRAGDR